MASERARLRRVLLSGKREQATTSMADEPWDGDGEAHLTGRASEEAEAGAGLVVVARARCLRK